MPRGSGSQPLGLAVARNRLNAQVLSIWVFIAAAMDAD